MWLDIGKNSNFLMIADKGREALVQKYCRKLQVYNFVNGHDNKLESMIEDCLFNPHQRNPNYQPTTRENIDIIQLS